MATIKSVKAKRGERKGVKASGSKGELGIKVDTKPSPSKTASVASVVESEMPGWSVIGKNRAAGQRTLSAGVGTGALDSATPASDSVMPSIDALQQRYQVAGLNLDAPPAANAGAGEPLNIVEVEAGGLKKTVAVQGGRVKWSQG